MYADNTQTFDSFIDLVKASDYDSTSDVEKAMDDFISKYSRLAVNVNSSLFGATNVKKVPGRDIYFVDGDLNIDGYWNIYNVTKAKISETKGNNAIYDRPFTIVQTKGNTLIKGSLNHNMMLLTNGTITFNGGENCDDAQVVRGVFYAKAGFSSLNVKKNTNLSNKDWCIGGNLHIKGVAIGDGLERVMENRRAELNRWFYSRANIEPSQADRRNYIMDGAAVLIEYSPSIFTTATMPPGAEDFTTALEVYRR